VERRWSALQFVCGGSLYTTLYCIILWVGWVRSGAPWKKLFFIEWGGVK